MAKKISEFGVEDYALERVPAGIKSGWLDLSLIWTGFTIVPVGLLYGAVMANFFEFWTATWIMLVASVIVVANSILMGYIGMRERTTYGLTTRFAFGVEGSRLPSAIVAISSQGWWAVELLMMISFWPTLGFWPTVVACIGFGALFSTTSRFGLQMGLKWLSRIAVPLLILLCVLSVFSAANIAGGWDKLVAYKPKEVGGMTIAAGIIMGIASWLNGSTMMPDVTRFARSGGAVVACGAISFMIGIFGLGWVGLIYGLVVGTANLGPAFQKLGLSALAFITVFLQVWTTLDNQLYSSSLALSNATRWNRRTSELVCWVAGVVAAIWMSTSGLQDSFINFMVFIGLFLTPVPGIIISEYYLVKRMRVPDLNALPAVNQSCIASYVITVALNVILRLFFGGSNIGVITLNPLTGLVIHLIVTYVMQSSAAAGGKSAKG